MSITSSLQLRELAIAARAVRPVRLAQALSITVLSAFAGACAPGVGTESQVAADAPGSVAQLGPRESQPASAVVSAAAPPSGTGVELEAARTARSGAEVLTDPTMQGACGRMAPFSAEYNSCCEEHAWDVTAGCSAPVGC